MDIHIAGRIAGVCCAVAMLAACVGGSSGGSGSPGAVKVTNPTGDLNDPGTWSYEGCKQELLQRVRRDHPQVQAVEIVGHVDENKVTDRKSTLVGEGKFPRNGDNFHLTFVCEVDREEKKIISVKYDKQ